LLQAKPNRHQFEVTVSFYSTFNTEKSNQSI